MVMMLRMMMITMTMNATTQRVSTTDRLKMELNSFMTAEPLLRPAAMRAAKKVEQEHQKSKNVEEREYRKEEVSDETREKQVVKELVRLECSGWLASSTSRRVPVQFSVAGGSHSEMKHRTLYGPTRLR
mmetsp:Transcript_7774/g.28447  ORF Transcript_7774/g.28447 Transcript_7774/m.28447 type:complete len:129 (+) Transcript_7774:940-1326(+)